MQKINTLKKNGVNNAKIKAIALGMLIDLNKKMVLEIVDMLAKENNTFLEAIAKSKGLTENEAAIDQIMNNLNYSNYLLRKAAIMTDEKYKKVSVLLDVINTWDFDTKDPIPHTETLKVNEDEPI